MFWINIGFVINRKSKHFVPDYTTTTNKTNIQKHEHNEPNFIFLELLESNTIANNNKEDSRNYLIYMKYV